MKKIYICAMALSVSSLSFGQSLTKKTFSEQKQQRIAAPWSKTSKTTPQNKAAGALIWNNDFSNPADWLLSNNSSDGVNWTITTDIDAVIIGGESVALELSTADNGYCYINSDEIGAGQSQDVTITSADTIDLSGEPYVTLYWEQNYMHFQEIVTVGVSGDNGVTWTDYIIDNGPVESPQPREYDEKSINISAVAGNSSNVKIRFNYQGAWDWFYSIDDVRIETTEPNDLKTQNGFFGFYGVEYSRIPASQLQPMSVSMEYENVGRSTQTESNLSVSIDNGGGPGSEFSGSTPNISIAAGTSDTLTWDSLWTPPATPLNSPYTVTLDIYSDDSTDFSPQNNTQTFSSFEITSSLMALDDFSDTPGNGGGNPGPNDVTEYEIGNQFDIIADETLWAIDVITGTNTPTSGIFIDAVLYEYNWDGTTGTFTEVYRSDPYEVTASDIGAIKHFVIPGGLAVTAGKTYMAAIHSFIGFEYATSGTGPNSETPAGTHSLIFYPNFPSPNPASNFSTSSTPMIRLNFDMTLGINDVAKASNFSVYPNPSNGEFTINLNSSVKTAAISVKNVVGQTILNKTVNISGRTTESISLTDYSKGVYFLTVNNETVKLIIE
jgi:hypothetical protein